MQTYEERLAAWEAELREKYTDKEREALAKKGIGYAMPDGSFPTDDREDVENAIHAVGRGSSDHDAIRKHIMAAAKRLGCEDLIPDDWNSDGSVGGDQKNQALVKAERRRKERRRAVALLPEVRNFTATGLEVRSSRGADEIVIRGSAIVYDTPYLVRDFWGEFEERMRPGCVSALLDRGVDCRLLLNHDGLALARTASGTLDLIDGSRALDIEARLDPHQHAANDFAIAVERGDMNQMSVGMVVGNDVWGEDGATETRDVLGLDDLLDVSGVTFPASPTTTLDVAQRMAAAMSQESRARVRKLYIDLRAADLRAGKVLSGKTADSVAQATKLLHGVLSSGGIDPASLIDNAADGAPRDEEDGSSGGDIENGQGESAVMDDGTGVRQDDPGEPVKSRAERRAAAEMSYNDKQRAADNALSVKYGDNDGDCDLWVCDMGDDWIVFECFVDPPGMGLWRIAYTEDGDEIVLTDDPVRVVRETSYQPVSDEQQRSGDEGDKTSRARRIRVEARRLGVI